MRKKARRHGGAKARRKTAKTSALDRFDLYELAVTSPVPLARFLKAAHGRRPRILGEDFSGTAALSRAWVEIGPRHRAIAVDMDPSVVARLAEACANLPARDRIHLITADVLRAKHPCDILACTNFPICYYHTRPALLKYLKHARSRLTPRGIFVADLYGGSDAFQTGKQTVNFRQKGQRVEYTWEQRKADPLSGRVNNAIHFRLNGRAIRNAFEYDWRLWSISELSDALLESGFRKVEIYDALGDAMDQHGNVMIRPAEQLADPYVVYVVAHK